MLRNRLIFSLIYSDGAFMQSRNFRLQRVGDINWLEKNYNFQDISFSLDELVVLNASRVNKDIGEFAKVVNRLVDDVFIPVSAGGGIRSLNDADILFQSGADKVVLNTSLVDDTELVRSIIEKYGAQAVIASVDYKVVDGSCLVFIENASKCLEMALDEYLIYVQNLGVGEVILNSIDKDGTGFGYDLMSVSSCSILSISH